MKDLITLKYRINGMNMKRRYSPDRMVEALVRVEVLRSSGVQVTVGLPPALRRSNHA